jgi:scyllo-inositol 2-dehydrogenase (NADP+)
MADVDDRATSVVLVGFGLAGRVFHGPLVETTPGLRLDAIVTGNPERRQQAAEAHPGAVIYDTPDQAWANGHDLAVICTANVTHVAYAAAALGNGLHVVLDKPIAPTASQAQGLADLAADRGRLLVPFQNRRWDSDFLTAQRVAHDGTIGRVHRFESRIERMRVLPKPGWRSSPEPADMGGMLYDLGAHLVDQALRLMGPVVSVAASVRTVRDGNHSDDDVVLLLEHQSGAVSHLVASQSGAFEAPRMTLYGTLGGLRIAAADSQEAALASGRRPVPDEAWGQEPTESAAVLRQYSDTNELTESRVTLDRGDWPAFYRGVATAVRGEGVAPVLVSDVVADLRVLVAARESGLRHSVVVLDPPAGHS